MRVLLMASVMCAGASQAWADALTVQEPARADAPARPRSAFGPGEQTLYSVSYLGVPTGQASVTVGLTLEKYGVNTWPIVCTAETTDVGAIYPVKDRFVTFWDPVGRTTVGNEGHADEGRERHRERTRFERAQGKAFGTKQWEGKPAKDATYDVPKDTLDMAAASFKLRDLPLSIGSKYELPVFTGTTQFTLKANITGREKIDTPLGEKDALKMNVLVEFNGGLKTKRALVIWVADDPSHLPLRIDAEFLIGTMRAEVVKYAPGMDYGGADL